MAPHTVLYCKHHRWRLWRCKYSRVTLWLRLTFPSSSHLLLLRWTALQVMEDGKNPNLPNTCGTDTNSTNQRSRRWIFIIEGIITVVAGVVTKFWVTDWPEQAKFLNEEERALLIARLSADTGDAVMDRLDKRAAKRIFSDPKIYLGTAAYFGKNLCCPLHLLFQTHADHTPPRARNREYWLCWIFLHPNNRQRTRLHLRRRPGTVDSHLCGSNYHCGHHGMADRSPPPSLLVLYLRSRRRIDWVHHASCARQPLSWRQVLCPLSHCTGWLHHSACCTRLDVQPCIWTLQAIRQFCDASWVRKPRRHRGEQHLFAE